MKKIFRKFILIVTVLILALGGTLTGCNEQTESAPDLKANTRERKAQVHVYNMTETQDYVVKNGMSDYVLVFPETPTSHLNDEAVSELLTFFKQATGVTLPSKPDTGLTFDEECKYISIGDTTIASQAGVQVDKTELGTGGYEIKTVNKSIFIAGGAWGEVYGVYGLLDLYFNFEVYTGDEIYIDTGVTELKLYDFDVKDIPDIEHMMGPYGRNAADSRRLTLKWVGDVYADNRGYVYHNMLNGIIPFELYGVDVNADTDVNGNPITKNMKDDILNHPMYSEKPEWFNHPEWYVMEKTVNQDPLGDNSKKEPLQVNLSVSVEGWSDEQNQISQDLLFDVMLYEMRLALDASPNRIMQFTPQDNTYWSDDAASMASYEKYGTHAAEYIQFANKIATELKKDYPDFRLELFAYSATEKAPVKKNDKGEFVPIDETVVLADNVDIMLCFSFLNRTCDVYNEKLNAEHLIMATEWAPLIKRASSWLYGLTYYANYFMPTNTLMGISDSYRYMYEQGYKMILDEAQVGVNGYVATDWAVVKTYLASKIHWDVYQNQGELIVDFFDNYFKAASKDMYEAFNLIQNRITELGIIQEDLTNIRVDHSAAQKAMLKESSWSDKLLQQILGKFDDAYKAIEVYKDTDPTLYSKLYDRINLESLAIRYLRIEIYGKYYGEQKAQWLKDLRKDAETLGMKRFGGLVTFDDYFGKA